MKSTCCIMLGQYRSASMHDANEGGDRITQIFLSLYRKRDKSYAPWRSTATQRQVRSGRHARPSGSELGRTKPADTSSFCPGIPDRTVLAQNQPPHSPTLTYRPTTDSAVPLSHRRLIRSALCFVAMSCVERIDLITCGPVFVLILVE